MNFMEFCRTQDTVLLDGAVGTELDKRGLMGRGEVNLSNAQAIIDIHRSYAEVGCQAILTNTLTMNRVYIETHKLGVDVEAVNRKGVELARQSVTSGQHVLGNMTSTGQLLDPFGTHTEDDLGTAFKEQAGILADAGVDGIVIETMFDLREAVCALKACKESTSIPVLVGMAFSTETRGGRTLMGSTAEDCAKQLTDAGADAVGANCGDLDPTQMAEVISMMRAATDLPLLAEPNAGKPRLVGDETIFDMDPIPFAVGVGECLDAGASILGGCCGTTPYHMEAVREHLERKSAKS